MRVGAEGGAEGGAGVGAVTLNVIETELRSSGTFWHEGELEGAERGA
jgi:hypothetical protein